MARASCKGSVLVGLVAAMHDGYLDSYGDAGDLPRGRTKSYTLHGPMHAVAQLEFFWEAEAHNSFHKTRIAARLNTGVEGKRMNERTLKQRIVVEQLLSDAAIQVQRFACLPEYENHATRGQFHLALDALTNAGEQYEVNAEYWRLLKKVAEVIGSNERVKRLRSKFQAARSSAIQLSIQPGDDSSANQDLHFKPAVQDDLDTDVPSPRSLIRDTTI